MIRREEAQLEFGAGEALTWAATRSMNACIIDQEIIPGAFAGSR